MECRLTNGPGIHDDILEGKAKLTDCIANHHIHCIELLWGKWKPLKTKENTLSEGP